MKKLFLIVGFILLAGFVSAQELTVYQYSEPFGRFSLTLNNENVSSAKSYYFTFSYLGEDWQAYRSITLNVDGKEYYLLFTNITQDYAGGIGTEICKSKYFDDELIASLRRANKVVCKVDSIRWNRQDTFSLSNDVLASIKQYVR